jgi:hypothetical protein
MSCHFFCIQGAVIVISCSQLPDIYIAGPRLGMRPPKWLCSVRQSAGCWQSHMLYKLHYASKIVNANDYYYLVITSFIFILFFHGLQIQAILFVPPSSATISLVDVYTWWP